jgi:hypothetical protein
MTPPVYPLTVLQGDTGHWRVVLWLDKDKRVPADLTGVEIEAIVKGPEGIISMEAKVEEPNIIWITLSDSDSAKLRTKSQWALRLHRPYEGKTIVQTVLYGTVSAVQGVMV